MYTPEELVAIFEEYLDDNNLQEDFAGWLLDHHNVTAAELGFEGIGEYGGGA